MDWAWFAVRTMSGRIHAFAVATSLGNVIYERFYDATNETNRAEVHAAFIEARSFVGRKAVPGQGYVGNYKSVH